MSPRSSLFKRAIAPLLAVAATTLTVFLCAPAHAATAAWVFCQAGTVPYGGGPAVNEQVQCVVEGANYWQKDVVHINLIGGGDDSNYPPTYTGYSGPGDFYDPSSGYYACPVHSTGTYNCWCICTGQYYEGPNSGQKWDVSTGGTKYVTF